jgi:WhiB family redox-sensing transcriptional regulator
VTDWRDRAACRGFDPERWFPLKVRWGSEVLDGARAICARCPVQVDCLDLALAVPEGLDAVGVFGGLLPAERRWLRTDPTLAVVTDTGHLRGGPPEDQRIRRDGTRG